MSSQLKILRAVNLGQGVAASVLGSQFNVYRLNGTSAGSVISLNSLVKSNFNCMFERTTDKHMLRNATFDLQCYEATCNGFKYLQKGDIITETGPTNSREQFCVVDFLNMKPYRTVLIRVESNCAIEQLHPGAGATEEMPTIGAAYTPFAAGYGGTTVGGRYQLTLNGGLYQMLPQGQGTLASIPIGIQPLSKVKDAKRLDLPTEFARTLFVAYAPPTPGYVISELDVIKGPLGDTYEIRQQYSSSPMGLVGSILFIERTAT